MRPVISAGAVPSSAGSRLAACRLHDAKPTRLVHATGGCAIAVRPNGVIAGLARGPGSSMRLRAAVADASAPWPEEQASSSQVSGYPNWLAAIRATIFYVTTLMFAAPLFLVMLALYPFELVFDKVRRRAEHFVNNIWAKLTTLFYYPVNIRGEENLPPADHPAVYVSNHLSFLDIYTLFHLNRDFKFISKTSNFLIPIIGWSMFLTGHIMLNRVDRRSQIECLKQCGQMLKQGASVLFFPEGTRSKDGKMYPFKKGAFSVAVKAKVPVIPITLIGTGTMMPNKREYLLFPGRAEVIIHPAIQSGDADEMMVQAYAAIAASLPPGMVAEP